MAGRSDAPLRPRRTVVIGVGNRNRGDDGAGPAVVDKLRRVAPEGVRLVQCEGTCTQVIEAWRGADLAVVIDAASGSGHSGRVHRFDARAHPLPRDRFPQSSHSFGLPAAVELARSLGELPPRVIVYAVEGETFEPGSGLSSPVEAALERLITGVLEEVGAVSG